MNPSPASSDRRILEIRGSRASTVIVQMVPADHMDAFMKWQHGICAEASTFPGYQTTEVFPPSGEQRESVAILHFDDATTLQNWIDSKQRAEWIARLPFETKNFRIKTLPSGFGAWFAGLDDEGKPLPHWKMALTVLFGLYPTVMALSLFLSPYTQRFGLAVAILIGNAVSVIFLEWLGMPVIRRFLRPWLLAKSDNGKRLSILGGMAIVGSLVVMACIFHLATRSS